MTKQGFSVRKHKIIAYENSQASCQPRCLRSHLEHLCYVYPKYSDSVLTI